MAYLVTGGTGYIGSHTVRRLLDAGKDVVCLQRSGVTPVFREVVGEGNIGRAKVVQGDMSDTLLVFEVVRRYDIEWIIHLACLMPYPGYTMPQTSELHPAYALKANCIGMNNMLEAVRLFGLKKLVWTSAGLALGRVYELYKEPIGDDNAIYRPDTMYGATTALNEFQAKIYFDKFKVDSVGFRLQRTYGTGKERGGIGAFNGFLKKAALGIPATIEDTPSTLGHLHVDDLTGLMVKACESPTTRTRVFNAVEGEYTNRQVADTVRSINPAARITLEKGRELPTYEGPHPRFNSLRVDATGLRTELGWQPEYSLEDGLRKVMNYFRQKEGMAPL